MKKIYFLFLSVLLSLYAQSQEINIEALTLEGAVEYSTIHSPAVNIQRLKEQQEEIKLSQIKLDYLPDGTTCPMCTSLPTCGKTLSSQQPRFRQQ